MAIRHDRLLFYADSRYPILVQCSTLAKQPKNSVQPELLHRYPKAHYKRTSKKNVSSQLSRIQMRQACIRKLQKQLLQEPDEGYQDNVAHSLPYFTGKSQNHPIGLPAFQGAGRGDPATKVRQNVICQFQSHCSHSQDFILRLKRHLVPRVYQRLLEEAEAVRAEDQDASRIWLLGLLVNSSNDSTNSLDASDVDQIYFHSDWMYEHNILNINYTSYDVRRETDIVNPKTLRRDVMCLQQVDEHGESTADPTSAAAAPPHRFLHARVLRIFHTNVVYQGRGSSDLRKRRFDFLLIRWFSFKTRNAVQDSLDRITLVPLSSADAVGFLDPANIVRASHIVPRYSLSQLHPDSQGSDRLYPDKRGSDPVVSKLAKDWEDYCEYYMNRYVRTLHLKCLFK